MKIIDIEKETIADFAGLKTGDNLVEINGHDIDDIIDFKFHSADENIELVVIRNGEKIGYDIEKDFNENLGLTFESMRFKHCGNKCIFCFVDQNPAGMRKEIYFKDEDYRLSFLFGNYVTLTNIRKKDLKKIVQLRLSPLYISVHAIDNEVRKKLLDLKKDDDLSGKISFLADNKIEMHGQIVLCPGINDGEILKQTISGLFKYYPYFSTIAVVPVGLTKHRGALHQIKPVTKDIASEIIDFIMEKQKYYKRKTGDNFVYLSDEFYILTDRDFPGYEDYDGFKQIENGVGLTRYFINEIDVIKKQLPSESAVDINIGIITGFQAINIIKEYFLPMLNDIKNVNAYVYPVKNEFFGDSVKVSGLLAGNDIKKEILSHKEIDLFLLPPNCLNHDDKFIDDLKYCDLEKAVSSKIMIFDDVKLKKYLESPK
ncbi:DUF512 domain-containing protein [candidate division KSB1 bacterium]